MCNLKSLAPRLIFNPTSARYAMCQNVPFPLLAIPNLIKLRRNAGGALPEIIVRDSKEAPHDAPTIMTFTTAKSRVAKRIILRSYGWQTEVVRLTKILSRKPSRGGANATRIRAQGSRRSTACLARTGGKIAAQSI